MKKVLVVDDDREMTRLLQTLFELEGYRVSVARTCAGILPAVREFKPDVVLMDVQVQDGRTVPLVREMRQDQSLAHIPVIMASGFDCRRECLEAGASLFILKPFLPDELVHHVNGLLKRDRGDGGAE